MKVFVFANDEWSLVRVHHDVARNLPDIEFTFGHWIRYDWYDIIRKFEECDVCLAGILCVEFFKNCFPQFDHKKCLFVCHGLEYNVNEHLEYANLTYSVTSLSVRHFFPENTKVFLTPNGVDPSSCTYTERDGSLKTLGWCGAPHVPSKQISWAIEISQKTDVPLSISSKFPGDTDISKWQALTYDEVREWYGTIDLLIVTARTSAGSETGPLPAFEAIVSGIPVVGTAVGNFANVPGPKFTNIEEGIEIVNDLKSNPEKMKELAKEQYDYVIANYTYSSFVHKWREAFEYVYSQNKHI